MIAIVLMCACLHVDNLSSRRILSVAVLARRRRSVHDRRAIQTVVVHRISRRRLGIEENGWCVYTSVFINVICVPLLGKKKVTLEVGGNAAVIVDDVDEGIEQITDRIVMGAYMQSGQSCIR
jgi:hypothetical protein